MNMLKAEGCGFLVCCPFRIVGLSALAFGAGILLCMILPSFALACIEAGILVGAGVVLFAK